jgi:hypothetical protein
MLVASDIKRAAALVVVSTFINLHVLYAPGFKHRLVFQGNLLPDERDNVLLKCHLFHAKLLDMGWLLEGNSSLFESLVYLNLGIQPHSACKVVVLARSFAGTGSDREAEARAFDLNLPTMTNAHGVVVIENLPLCLCAVS